MPQCTDFQCMQLHCFKSPHIFLSVFVLQMMEWDARATIITAVTNGELIHTHAMQQQPVIQLEQLRMLNRHTGKGRFKEWETTKSDISSLISSHTTPPSRAATHAQHSSYGLVHTSEGMLLFPWFSQTGYTDPKPGSQLLPEGHTSAGELWSWRTSIASNCAIALWGTRPSEDKGFNLASLLVLNSQLFIPIKLLVSEYRSQAPATDNYQRTYVREKDNIWLYK